jgi:hypothetical protein
MNEEWIRLKEFPTYAVSPLGNVLNVPRRKLIRQSVNRQGVVKVNLFYQNKTYCRSVALLVCQTFKPHESIHFDSVIHLNGDKSNNHIDNLEPRPHWFAYTYNKQFKPGYRPRYSRGLRDQATGVEYSNSLVVSTSFGILDTDVYEATKNNTFTFPTNQFFEFIDF